MAPTPSGNGYWLVASDGGIFAFGDASFRGSMGAKHLNRPIVGMASTASGKGYRLVASDGGIFAFGDASFRGSTGNIRLVSPIVGMQSSGNGYRFVAGDGGVFTFGLSFEGSAAGFASAAPAVARAHD
jgi:ribosomal protein L24E